MVVDLKGSGRTVPFKLAGVVNAAGVAASAARVHYAHARMPGDEGFLRQPIIASNPDVMKQIPHPAKQYFDAIAASDQFAWQFFTPDGYSNGGSSTPLKRPGLKKFYAVLGAEPGGVPLSPATVTCDEQTCAIEENLTTWDTIVFERDTAGLAVYDIDNASGLLSGARAYDDIPQSPFGVRGWIAKNSTSISNALAKSGCQLRYKPSSAAPPGAVRGELFGAACE